MILFPLVLILTYVYLGLRLGTNLGVWILLFFITFGIMTFLFRKIMKAQVYFSFICMGLLTYLLVYTILRDIISLFYGPIFPVQLVWVLSVTTLFIGFLNAYFAPRIKTVSVPVQDLPQDLQGLRIVQISDLHIGATIREKYVRKVVNKTNALKPDVIVLTGDIGDGNVKQHKEDVLPLRELKARHGSFFVPGNHEYYWSVNEWLTMMNNLGIINLVNRGKVIHHGNSSILLAGIPDPVSRLPIDLAALQDSEPAEKAQYRILLSHRPGIAENARENGFDLVLAGHTHGGQFFPWNIVVKFVHRFSQGLYQLQKMWIYVSPGTGSWGPLVRLGTRPEITLLILHLEKKLVTT